MRFETFDRLGIEQKRRGGRRSRTRSLGEGSNRRPDLRFAADEPSKLPHARQKPLAAERREVRRQSQDHATLCADHRGARQHPRHRGGNVVGDSHRRAENSRPIELPRRHQRARLRRNKIFIGHVPVGSGQREKRARGMIDADEGCVGHQIVGLDAAIVGMRAPGNIRQQTCGVAQAPILIVLLEMGRIRSGGSSRRKALRHAQAPASAAG